MDFEKQLQLMRRAVQALLEMGEEVWVPGLPAYYPSKTNPVIPLGYDGEHPNRCWLAYDPSRAPETDYGLGNGGVEMLGAVPHPESELATGWLLSRARMLFGSNELYTVCRSATGWWQVNVPSTSPNGGALMVTTAPTEREALVLYLEYRCDVRRREMGRAS